MGGTTDETTGHHNDQMDMQTVIAWIEPDMWMLRQIANYMYELNQRSRFFMDG
jgi:hypothetical protein